MPWRVQCGVVRRVVLVRARVVLRVCIYSVLVATYTGPSGRGCFPSSFQWRPLACDPMVADDCAALGVCHAARCVASCLCARAWF